MAVRSHLGCELALREIRFRKGHFVLKDVLLVDQEKEESLRTEEIQIKITPFFSWPIQIPLHIQVSLYRPHLVLRGVQHSLDQMGETKFHWVHVGIEVKKGSFDWLQNPSDPLIAGSFTYSEEGLHLKMGEGSFLASWKIPCEEKIIDCEMKEWPIAPFLPLFTDHFISDVILGGTLNGNVRIARKSGSIDQLSVEFQNVLIEKGLSRLEEVTGTVYFDPILGLSWKGVGSSFLWEGKHAAGLSHDFQTTVQLGDARAALSYSSSRYSLDISKADKHLIQLIQSFSQSGLSCQLEEGDLSGQFEWTMDEELRIQYSSVAGNLSIQGAQGRWGSFLFEDLILSTEVSQGAIERGYLQAKLEGWNVEADLSGTLKDILLHGSLSHQEKAFFDGEIHVEEGEWAARANLSGIQWGPLREGSLSLSLNSQDQFIEWSNVQGRVAIGEALFPVQGMVRQESDGLFFDLSLQYRFYDLVRLRGVKREQDFSFDSEKSHVLGSPFQIKECRITKDGSLESLQIQHRFTFSDIHARSSCLREIDPALAEILLKAPLSGSCLLAMDFFPFRIQLQGEDMSYLDEPIAFFLDVSREGADWRIAQLRAGPFSIEASLLEEEGRWKIERGKALWNQETAAFQGYLTGKGVALSIAAISADLSSFPINETLPRIGRVEGSGYLSMEWEKSPWTYELDLDLSSAGFQFKDQNISNEGALQLHFSDQKILSIRGLNLDFAHPFVHSRIELLQFDVEKQQFHLEHAELRLPARSLSHLSFMDQDHDFECIADIDVAADLSTFSCSMREGFIPFLGSVRHVQNVHMEVDNGQGHVTMQAIHQGHSLGLSASFRSSSPLSPSPSTMRQWGPLSGVLILEDEEEPSCEASNDDRGHPLTVHWELDQGDLKLHSIEGTFGGLEASFCETEPGVLIGRARLDFSYLSDFLPSRISKVFGRIKMGKGYELKGRLLTENGLAFEGWLSGKSCELFGVQIRTLLAQLSLSQTEVRLSNIKASDFAGILKIDELILKKPVSSEEGDEEPWSISSPSLTLEEFRPSLLHKIGREPGLIGPLVVRELKITDFKGLLEESQTYSAKGECSFINSFKREHTVFDLPADFLGRIFGLDLELLIPVTGKMNFELKEGRIWLRDLFESYSEGKRSKFFLVKEGLSPSVDLDGHLNILVKMKQYVLFKITEHFLLSIDGTIAKPAYHLQKKSKLFGG